MNVASVVKSLIAITFALEEGFFFRRWPLDSANSYPHFCALSASQVAMKSVSSLYDLSRIAFSMNFTQWPDWGVQTHTALEEPLGHHLFTVAQHRALVETTGCLQGYKAFE